MTWNDFNTEAKVTDDSEEIKAMFPNILYKYRMWEDPFHKSILTNQNVYFASAYQFIDPKDCRFPVDFDFSYERAEAFFMHDIRKNKNRLWTDEQIKSFAKYKHNEGFGSPEKQDQKKQDFYRLFNHHQGILCLCKRNDVPSMWNEYGEEFKGFCVGVSLNDYIDDLKQNLIFGGTVSYVEANFPPLKYVWASEAKEYELPLFFLRLITTKYDNFKHEDEYRLGKYFPGSPQRTVTDVDRIYKVPKSSVMAE